MAGSVQVNKSGNQDIDGLLWGYRWDTTSLTYAFPTSSAEYINSGYASVSGFQTLTAAQQNAYAQIIDNINSFSGLDLTLNQDPNAFAEIRFGMASSINYGGIDTDGNHTPGFGTAEGNPPDPTFGSPYQWGDIWFNTARGVYNNPTVGSFAFSAGLMHEFGHALGLKHGHAAQPAHGVTFPTLPANHDSYEYSVMTYRQYPGDNVNGGDNAPNHPTTYMQDDIAALQYLYGANFGFHNEDTVYQFDPANGQEFVNGVAQNPPNNNFILMTVWDGGGVDTYDFSNYTTPINADLSPGGWINLGTEIANLGDGHFARGNIANAQLYQGNTGSLIENVVGGSGADVLLGNVADNTLNGGDGNDQLSGLGGNDLMIGGAGADLLDGGIGWNAAGYESSPVGVLVDLRSGTGTSGDAQGDVLHNIQTLLGSAFNDLLLGDAAGNNLLGGAGDDMLWGNASADYLDGGAGENTAAYDTSPGAVQVNLAAHAGLAADAQGDILFNIQDVVGSSFGDVLMGDDGPNKLFGGGGDDWLFGLGGPDMLDGGAGENTAYYDASPGPIIIDLGGGIGAGANAQGDILVNIQDVVGSAFGDVLFGDAGANKLYGGLGDDWLFGGGGADLLDGGGGDNTAYYSTSTIAVMLDLRVGAGSGGDAQGDTLVNIEDLVGSPWNDALIGDSHANRLMGGEGNDILWGLGGADLLDGGSGENTASYDVSPGPILINLAAGQGLAADAQGDVLTNIQDVVGSFFGDVLIGDAGPNKLYGGGGDDWLFGGPGADLLDGGSGVNTAWYDTAPTGVQVNLATGTGAGGDAEGDLLVNIQNVVGSHFADGITGNGADNQITGGLGADMLTGGGGNDTFIFHPGEVAGDTIVDFNGNGAATGDQLLFQNFGAGATFTQIDAVHWQVNYDANHETIAFSNAALIHPSDILFA